jgi:hypothetical protein
MRDNRSKIRWTDKNMSVNLTINYDRWEDPGDYPSGAGSGPLPPGPWQVDHVDGTVRVRLTREVRWEMIRYDTIQDWASKNIGTLDIEGVKSIKWSLVRMDGEWAVFQVDEVNIEGM